jgi:putative hydrolase of the HAD superfamily
VDEVIICGQYGINKPDERIFAIAAEKLGLACSEIAMVGDMFFTDIFGAQKAGMMPVWYTGNENVISDYPVTRVRTFGEIYDLFHGEDSE